MPDVNLPAVVDEPVEGERDVEIARTEIAKRGGMWQPGQSGNPKGRPKGSKNHLAQLNRELEIAVRENLNPSVIRGILERMAELALAGNIKAAKLLLDKLIANANSGGDEEGAQAPVFVFEVKNLTLKQADERPVIDITPKEQIQ